MSPKNWHTIDLSSCTPDCQRFIRQSVADTFVNIFVCRGRRWPQAIKQTTETVQNLTSILTDKTHKLQYRNVVYREPYFLHPHSFDQYLHSLRKHTSSLQITYGVELGND